MPHTSLLLRCKACKTLNRVPSDKLSAHPICGQCKAVLEFPHEPIHVTAASFDQQVRDWPEFLLAEFWARWCGHCRRMEPFLSGLAARRAGGFKVIRIDVDAEPVLAGRFTIKATPTFILYRNGSQIGRFDGAPVRDQELEFWIDRTIEQNSRQG